MSTFFYCHPRASSLSFLCIQGLQHPFECHLPIGLTEQSLDLRPVRAVVDRQRDPSLASRIRRGEKAAIVEQFILSVESYFHTQRQSPVFLAEGSEHLLAGAESRMAPRFDFTSFGQP